MARALEVAKTARGRTHPNPAVGAVIEHSDLILAEGATQPAGGPHAEIVAMEAFRKRGLTPDESTTLFVTLEPCSTTGRTPPCTDAIIASGIKRVVVGAIDPNPRHRGRGLKKLRDAGIEVASGVLAEDCEDLNLLFNYWMKKRAARPMIAAKVAMTLDGCIATHTRESKWITGKEAREESMAWRAYFPAIGVGARTVLSDDPRLTIRLAGEKTSAPIRFVFDRAGLLSASTPPKVFSDSHRKKTIVVTSERFAGTYAKDLTVWSVADDMEETEAWTAFANRCAQEEIMGVLFEGGARVLSGLLAARQIDYMIAFHAPIIMGDGDAVRPFSGAEILELKDAPRLTGVRHAYFGPDSMMRGWLKY